MSSVYPPPYPTSQQFGGPCDFSVTPSHNYTFGFGTSLGLGLGLGLGGLDLGLGLDKSHFLSSAEFLEEEAEARIQNTCVSQDAQKPDCLHFFPG